MHTRISLGEAHLTEPNHVDQPEPMTLTLAGFYAPLDKQKQTHYDSDVCKECPTPGALCEHDQITVQKGFWRGVSTSTSAMIMLQNFAAF